MESLGFDHYGRTSLAQLPSTSENDSRTEFDRAAMGRILDDSNVDMPTMDLRPSNLCRWSIHYEPDPILPRCSSPEPDPDLCNELLKGLASNSFSDVISNDPPVALPRIVQACGGTSNTLLAQAYGLSIMARNIEGTERLRRQMSHTELGCLSHTLQPVNLATTFLDGARTCCSLLDSLLFRRGLCFHPADTNTLGHTVMDNLMIAILRAHTSITPGAVDDALRDESRFPGEEVDMCGRWDADSDCIRDLIATGRPEIPFLWKHKFCHTSAQTICHCIRLLSAFSWEKGDDSIHEIPSGLFVKRCFNDNCGLEMPLTFLHVVVLVAFCLAQYGHEDEDLFGMLAVLLSALNNAANPTRLVDLDVTILLNIADTSNMTLTGCNHEKLSPTMLAERVPLSILENWSSKKRTGWEIICNVLRRSTKIWDGCEDCTDFKDKYGEDETMFRCQTCDCFVLNCVEKDPTLGVLWSAVQTELLTYRRLEEGDGWVSPNFNMDTLLAGLKKGDSIDVALVEKDMMPTICPCGIFVDYKSNGMYPGAEQVEKLYHSNLRDSSRTTFIPEPNGVWCINTCTCR